MRTRPFSVDPAAKIVTRWHEDHDGAVVVETEQDVSGIIEDAKANYNLHDERSPWQGDLHRVASVPMPMLLELYKEGVMESPARFAAWLNDSDNRAFRTRPGRV